MSCDVVVVLQHQMDVPSALDSARTSAAISSSQSGSRDGMNGIEAQAVEAIFVQPVQRVVGEEPATCGRRKSIAGPHGVRRLAEELRRVERQIVPVRPEVVVDDVEEHHQAEPVRGVDQRLQIRRACRSAFGRERQNAVVAPVARAGKSAIGISSIAVTPRSASRGNSPLTPAKPPRNPTCSS